VKKCHDKGCFDSAAVKQTYADKPVFSCARHVLTHGRDTVWSVKGFNFDGKAIT